ncbi:MAG: ATP-binding cassette domain-containing protein, partial [Syntrophobacteraceae bacterium]|nr:ATP-binding cassette domain-containing protein [Syntrophobacteraceae bacterium]
MTVAPPRDQLLLLQDISVSFNAVSVVDGLSLEIGRREICALVGPNGAGKTTLLKTIAGLLKPSRGHVIFEGNPMENLSVWEIVARGIVYVPEGMRVFRDMSVLENLELGAYLNRHAIPERLDMIFHLLPELKEKREVR